MGPTSVFSHVRPFLFAVAALLLFQPAAPALAAGPLTELSLKQAIGLAIERDANADRARRSAAIADLQVADARASYRPNADVSIAVNQSATGSTYRADDLALRRGLEGNFVGTVTANVSMPVDISGAIGRQVEAAKINDEVAKLGYVQARNNALIDVQIAYLTALQAKQQADTDSVLVSLIDQLKKRASKDLPAIVPFIDVELANARDTAETSLASAEQAEDALKLQLRLPLSLEVDLTTPLSGLSAPAIADGPQGTSDLTDIQIASRRVDAAQLSVEQAKDARRPSLRLGGYATQTFSGRFIDEAGKTTNRDYGLSVSLNLPLLNYDAGRNKNSVRSSRLMAEQASADLDSARLAAELNAKQAKTAYQRAETRLKQLPDTKAAAEALVSATDALFAAPAETAPGLLAQVSNARSSWRAAEATLISAQAGALIAALRLARTLDQPVELDGSAGS